LLHLEGSRLKPAGAYQGAIVGCPHEYLEVDFYEQAPCQLVGSVHASTYQFAFSHFQTTIDLRTYCEKHCRAQEEPVLAYLHEEGLRAYTQLAETYSLIAGAQVELRCPRLPELRKEKREPLKVKELV
jgi:hypothetical protein